MNGDQRNLNVQGACARVMSPTTRMSTPMSRIQSGIANHTSPKGRPEEKERRETDPVRQDVIAWNRLSQVPSWRRGSLIKKLAPAPVELFHFLDFV
jgi:hypothetical protein